MGLKNVTELPKVGEVAHLVMMTPQIFGKEEHAMTLSCSSLVRIFVRANR